MLMYGKVSQENYVELTAASAIPNKEIKSPQILRYYMKTSGSNLPLVSKLNYAISIPLLSRHRH